MRTLIVVVAIGLLTFSAVTSGEPVTDAVQASLDDVALPLDLLHSGEDGDDAVSHAEDSQDAAFAASAMVIADPFGTVQRTLVELGLSILSGFFSGVAGGASTVGTAFALTAAVPVKTAGAAAVTFALAGLLTALGLAAQRYGSLGAIPLFSRIAKADLLDNATRARIFDFIRANPGVNVSEISRRLDVAWGTATHHLQKLRGEKLVAVREMGHQKCYFPNGGAFTPQEMDVMSATKSETAKKIAEYVVATGPVGHREVSLALGLSPALVSFHARKLETAGVVARRREGRRTFFVPVASELTPAPRPSVHAA